MARIRSLKPEILEDDRTASLSDPAFRLFVALILLADDHGNVRADERWLDGQVWWAHDRRGDSRKSAASLRELSGQGLVLAYTVRDQLYVSIRGWKKHQRIDNAGKPRVPLSSDPEAEILQNFAANRGETPLDLRSPITITITSTEGEREGKHALPSAAQHALPPADPESVERFYTTVEQHVGDVGKRRVRAAKGKSVITAHERAIATRVLARLTQHNGVTYRSEAHVALVVDRLRDGVTEAELRAVVNWCALDLKWATDERERMGKYLQPSTLFGPKSHVKYLDPARAEYADAIAKFKPDEPQLALVPEAG